MIYTFALKLIFTIKYTVVMRKRIYTFHSGIKRITLFALTVLLSVSGTLRAADITSGLIVHYTFEDVIETIINDASGNSNIATIQGGATLANGYSGMGINMMTKPDYLRLPENIHQGMTSFTFAAWVNFSALRNATRFFDFGTGENGTNNFMVFIPSASGDNTNMRLRFREANGTSANVDATTRIPLNTWAHVALTINWDETAQNSKVRIYLNGVVVGSSDNYPYNPSRLGASTADNYLGFSRWTQDINGFSGTMDDVRIYNRALSIDDILELSGLAELKKQYDALDLGDISEITENITLPTTIGDQGVSISWSSSRPDVIDSLGNVTRPEKFDAVVQLSATLSLLIGDKVNTLTKVFYAKVLGMVGTPELIAQWNFNSENIFSEGGSLKVKDASESEYIGTVMNEARIRTIGETEQFNVLDLGNGTGYFDMGTDIGEAIYALSDYTMMGYFYINEGYNQLTNNGNFMWTFSNTDNAPVDQNGYIIGRLNNISMEITPRWYASGNQGLYLGRSAEKGSWQHFAYTQKGNTGTIYINGVQAGTGTITNLASSVLPQPGRIGTLYNWLGRANYPSDVYLRQTLLYDFQVYSVPLTSDNLLLDMEVSSTLSRLNAAYTENPDFINETLTVEMNSLDLGNLSAVTSNITLPTQGTSDPGIAIIWSSSHEMLISNEGQVNRPDYFDFPVTLTATLMKGAQALKKDFTATVLKKEGTAFAGDLIARFDFSNAEGRIVRDKGEKQFIGTTVNDASIRTIGTQATGTFDVLDLGNGTGYFDMGEELGKAMYHLENYTIGGYYLINQDYTGLGSNGNFLWTISNTDDAMARRTGYIIGSLRNQSLSITPGYYEASTGNQALGFNQPALQGNWHHFAYTQNDGIGTIYIDGMAVIFGDITNTPRSALLKPGLLGTPFNWIGRSNYVADVYLRQALVHDFRIYQRALNDVEILLLELNVAENLEKLDAAYAANPNNPSGVISIIDSPYRLNVQGNTLTIGGLKGTENIHVYDVAGRNINTSTIGKYNLTQGIYIVKIDGYTAKVMMP